MENLLTNDVFIVFVAASITAITTGFGAIPFLFVPKISNKWLSISNALAAGLMLSASFGLLFEANGISPLRSMGGFLTGLVFIYLANLALDKWDHPEVADMSNADAKKSLLIMGVMTLHSFAEGVGVGVSFGGEDVTLGVSITTAIAIHNIPEGLAISLILVPRGVSVFKAGGWSVFSSLPQPLMAVPAFLFVLVFQPWLPFGLALAAGAMIWMVFAELLPDAIEHISPSLAALLICISFLAMYFFQNYVMH